MGIYIKDFKMPEGGYRTIEIGYDADGHPMALVDGGDVFDVIPTSDMQPRWIPVSERLPEEKTSVLVYKHGDWIQPAKRIDVCKYLGDGVFYLLNVTHWMPLPERPKEGTGIQKEFMQNWHEEDNE